INGLPIGAIKTVTDLTSQALKLTGKLAAIPTFFDADGDGIVHKSDTIKGLQVLGLDESKASYAALALHTIFGYATQEGWVPDTAMPIRVKNMGRTRWGRNWGNFERLDWVDDVEIDDFFGQKKTEKQWGDYWRQGRQYFGVLLLIFEWGTTWPFLMPDLPIQDIPFKDDIGKVVRTAILPTILKNFQKARDADPNIPDSNKKSKPPSEKAPDDHKDA
ncbi:hypothetical protein BT69DRAFT_1331109, partial [Atractiella rhizophila]